MTTSSQTSAPHVLSPRALHHHLPVGFFADHRHAPRLVHVEGIALGSIVRIRMSAGPEETQVPVTEHLVLYHCSDDPPYIVHSVLERPDQRPTKLGIVENYSTWTELSGAFPGLARRAMEVARDRGLALRVSPRPVFERDPDDPSCCFG